MRRGTHARGTHAKGRINNQFLITGFSINSINNRPRKCLDDQTPNEVFYEGIAVCNLTKYSKSIDR
ncbi:MAG: hypothetical protein EWV75_22030 [Microcystis wesenbergii Mw_QC_S_20081001_S30D]|uniref:Uncharacterized protein n=1 Tax=Microcystis wesenbergii Mw_QC_S_20081001_S30D TaxID=2486245 RepID=A0A552J7L3_9CHRO|nr:MAG: hypothetical protein EWV75_22030 [Microcystis wesenbergii Mw_QC_S_20081001_S30D]TRV02941.1 MAG: hypothetical protein EWV74_07735 [Microcystis wesenbergii Mw_QC_S_20081001_S30]TRV04751.1 MAG: hypothetical protein EWV73_02220 [Microcystis wesenbergii Mw_QC_B_20070930_S4D]TRV16939.1 MAG: hypothetical protein EWV89_03930 [Microcystis wesenbergii Mw_QC_B_20070930_S4]